MTVDEVNQLIENNDIKELDKLADGNWKTKMELLSSENCPLKYLEQLKFDSDGLVRQFVAKNSNCSKEILNYFVDTEKDVNMLMKIVSNKNSDEEILNKISQKNIYDMGDVFRLMIINPNCSESLLLKRSLYSDSFSLELIKENKNCPEYLSKIIDMNYDEIKKFAATTENQKAIKYLFEKGSFDMFELSDNKKAQNGLDILHKLIDNPNTTKELLNDIAKYDYSLLHRVEEKNNINNINKIHQK